MSRYYLGTDVFTEAVERMASIYRDPLNRVVVAFSAGKDSGIVLEVCRTARDLERPGSPVEVAMRDEEIMYPGTFEYAERVASWPDIDFRWLIANQPIINVFDREHPYWWVFDPLLPPEQWVRQPPPFSEHIPDLDIVRMVDTNRFPPPEGGKTWIVLGLRVSESARRAMGIKASGSYRTKGPDASGCWRARPIYDWSTGDVWKAVADNGWDYNHAYDVMTKMGVPREMQRIAPPTMTQAGTRYLWMAAAAWPQWWDRVCQRVPGMRTVAQYGLRAVTPRRRLGETWEQTFQRECIDEAPAWVAERAALFRDRMLRTHRSHGKNVPFPETTHCYECSHPLACWMKMALNLYGGDPFSLKSGGELPYVDPEFFRPGSGRWADKPTWG